MYAVTAQVSAPPMIDPPEDQEEGREFSTPYESGVYYDRLMDVEMTGIYSEDLLRVAFSQEGAKEGESAIITFMVKRPNGTWHTVRLEVRNGI